MSPAEPPGLRGRLNPPALDDREQRAMTSTDGRERRLVHHKGSGDRRRHASVGCARRLVPVSGGEMNSPSTFPGSYFLSLCRSR